MQLSITPSEVEFAVLVAGQEAVVSVCIKVWGVLMLLQLQRAQLENLLPSLVSNQLKTHNTCNHTFHAVLSEPGQPGTVFSSEDASHSLLWLEGHWEPAQAGTWPVHHL
jgi:hypothetical protein